MVIGGQTFLKFCRATHSTLLSDTAKNCELGICFIYKSEWIVTVIKKIFLMPIIVIFSYTSSTIFTFVPVLFFIFILFKLQPVCLGGIDLNAFQGFFVNSLTFVWFSTYGKPTHEIHFYIYWCSSVLDGKCYNRSSFHDQKVYLQCNLIILSSFSCF